MDERDKEFLRQKLLWYLYECQYMDYNDQEVNFLLKELKENDIENEKEIVSSYIIFSHKAISENTKRKIPVKRITTISLASLAIASSLFISISLHNRSIAGLKNGIFHYIRKDETGVEFFIFPEEKMENEIYRAFSMEEVPNLLQDKIWIPEKETNVLELVYIDFTNEEIVSIKFADEENRYIQCFYSSDKEYDDHLQLYKYNGIKIYFYETQSDSSDTLFCYTFKINKHKYIVESNIEDILYYVYEFVDFLSKE